MKSRRLSDIELKVYKTAIGSGFKKLRLNAGKTIQEIAIAVDIHPTILENLERGEYDLLLEEYLDLCEYYNIKPTEFMENLEID